MKAFITGTGTGVGKTWFTTRLASNLVARGLSVAAIKPIETGCEPDALDALALATACGRPALAHVPGFHRGLLPRAPYSATLAGEASPPPLKALAQRCKETSAGMDAVLIEGAGGLLVPYDREHDVADLVLELDVPVIVVAPNSLGTLSNILLTAEALAKRNLRLAAVALNEQSKEIDPASEHHVELLVERLRCEVQVLPFGAGAKHLAFDRIVDSIAHRS